MNNSQQNKLSMYESAAKILDENKSIWQNLKALAEAVQEFTALLDALRNKGVQRAKNTTGVTQGKNAKKEQMAKKAAQLAASAFAYAEKLNDKVLQAKFNYSITDIKKTDDNNAISLTFAITEEAEKIQDKLADYGVQPEEISEVKSLGTEFKNFIGEKANVKSGRVAATGSLSDLFKAADNLLKNQIDKLLMRLKDQNPEFYRTYQNARAIRDLGGRTRKKEEESSEKV